MRKPQPVDITKLVQVTHLDPEPEFMTSSLLLSLPFQTTFFPVCYRSSLSLWEQKGGEGEGRRKALADFELGREVLTRGNSRQQWLPAW